MLWKGWMKRKGGGSGGSHSSCSPALAQSIPQASLMQAPAPSTASRYFFLQKINFLGFFFGFFFAVSVLEHGQERLAINYGGLSPLWRRRGKSREPEEGEHSSSLEGWG